MQRNYLLTYKDDFGTDYAWFETEKEMENFIEANNIDVLEAFHITDCEQLK